MRGTVRLRLAARHADFDWKPDCCNIERLTPAEIARRRAEFDRGTEEARQLRDVS
jgi:hypothetical protein